MIKGIRSATGRIRLLAGVVIRAKVVFSRFVVGFGHLSQMPPKANAPEFIVTL